MNAYVNGGGNIMVMNWNPFAVLRQLEVRYKFAIVIKITSNYYT